MLKNLFDGVLSIFVILSIAFLVVGNIGQFAYWIKRHKIKKDIGMQYFYLDFWDNEWGTECTKEEIQNLKEMIKQFEEKHKETGNEYVKE